MRYSFIAAALLAASVSGAPVIDKELAQVDKRAGIGGGNVGVTLTLKVPPIASVDVCLNLGLNEPIPKSCSSILATRTKAPTKTTHKTTITGKPKPKTTSKKSEPKTTKKSSGNGGGNGIGGGNIGVTLTLKVPPIASVDVCLNLGLNEPIPKSCSSILATRTKTHKSSSHKPTTTHHSSPKPWKPTTTHKKKTTTKWGDDKPKTTHKSSKKDTWGDKKTTTKHKTTSSKKWEQTTSHKKSSSKPIWKPTTTHKPKTTTTHKPKTSSSSAPAPTCTAAASKYSGLTLDIQQLQAAISDITADVNALVKVCTDLGILPCPNKACIDEDNKALGILNGLLNGLLGSGTLSGVVPSLGL